MCGVGPHLIHTLSHVKYKGENDQVRTLRWQLMQTWKGIHDIIITCLYVPFRRGMEQLLQSCRSEQWWHCFLCHLRHWDKPKWAAHFLSEDNTWLQYQLPVSSVMYRSNTTVVADAEWFTKAAPDRLRGSLCMWTLAQHSFMTLPMRFFITMYFVLTTESLNNCKSFTCSVLFSLCHWIYSYIPVRVYRTVAAMQNDREINIVYIGYVRICIRSEYVSCPFRKPYHRFRHRSQKPPKWVRNRHSSARNQTPANGDDTSRNRHRYDVAFLAVYPVLRNSVTSLVKWSIYSAMWKGVRLVVGVVRKICFRIEQTRRRDGLTEAFGGCSSCRGDVCPG